MKIKVPKDEAAGLLGRVKGDGDMGKLFADFKVFDYKKANEDLRKAKEELKDTKEELKDTKAKVGELKKELQELRASMNKDSQ